MGVSCNSVCGFITVHFLVIGSNIIAGQVAMLAIEGTT